MNALIDARDVVVQYPGTTQPTLFGISLRVAPGASVGIVGESGSGKSTFANTLAGLVSPTSGTVHVEGSNWTEIGRHDRRRRDVQMIFQDPYGALNPRKSALAAVEEVFRVVDRDSARTSRQRAAALLADVGLGPELHHRRPSRLSGGQCQRVVIARALACEPRVLIADEPTSALDLSVQAQILNLITSLQSSRGLALVVVSHDLGVIQHMTNHTLVLHQGRVVEEGATAALFADPTHDYTKTLVRSAY